ncbi:unnamed protein product [Caenorhabditis bovis]|uniref:Uncharacterized protein n=1 Tax=Caenorhabditis bovis TaxID=2654633 RepID=A0A8S1FB44_9PELO|nr:unnamed protein product [Caenorhabditis bovis]
MMLGFVFNSNAQESHVKAMYGSDVALDLGEASSYTRNTGDGVIEVYRRCAADNCGHWLNPTSMTRSATAAETVVDDGRLILKSVSLEDSGIYESDEKRIILRVLVA